MRFVTVRELRSESAKTWRRLAEEGELVITSNGKPIAILSAVAPDGVEQAIAAMRRARAIAAVEALQCGSVVAGKHRLTEDQIEAEIATVRQGRAP
jgi:antitoxin (DNA-binding transcriptional repressor) of toxin-antitoxin stability system